MKTIDTETRYDGENYKAIGAHGRTEEEFLYFAQPIKAQLESHREHDKALNQLLDRDFIQDGELVEGGEASYRLTTLEPDYEDGESQ